MDPEFESLAARWSLGALRSPAQPVPGGELHRAWRLETDMGAVLLKRLSRAVVAGSGAIERIRAAERLAARLAAAGVPAIAAVALDGDPLRQVAGAYWQLFRWIEGTVVSGERVGVAQARAVGAALGAMHAARFDEPGLGPVEAHQIPDAEWTSLTRLGEGRAWSVALAGARGALRAAATRAEAAGPVLGPAVASHRDLVPANVIWRIACVSPAIIDWESAGWVVPGIELARTAMAWSATGVDGHPERERFAAVIAGHRAAGARAGGAPEAMIDGALGAMLPGVAHALRRSLGDRSRSAAARQRADELAAAPLVRWRALVERRAEWAGWLRDAIA